MCKHCLDNETLICEVCHTRIWNNDDYGDDYTNLCRNCYNEHYTRCERCNDLIRRDDANYFDGSDIPYCNECYDEMEESSAIHDYGYKPDPIFYGNDKLYYGVELEVDCGGEINDNAEKLYDIANKNDEYSLKCN